MVEVLFSGRSGHRLGFLDHAASSQMGWVNIESGRKPLELHVSRSGKKPAEQHFLGIWRVGPVNVHMLHLLPELELTRLQNMEFYRSFHTFTTRGLVSCCL